MIHLVWWGIHSLDIVQDAILRRLMIKLTIAESLIRNDYWGISFCAYSTSQQMRLRVPNTILFNIIFRSLTINSINNEVYTFPELISKNILCFASKTQLIMHHIQSGVQSLGCYRASTYCLIFSYVFLSEEEFPIKVWDFNVVIVSTVNSAFFWAAYSHESECLYVFTTKSTCSNKEGINIMKFLLYISSVDSDLVVVSRVKRSSINWASWQSVKDVVVEPLH